MGEIFSNLSDFEFNFSNASDFGKKNSKRVRFWFKSFTKRQILDWKKYNALDFELKIFGHVRFWKNVCIQKIRFWFILLRENDIFCIFGAFLKSIFLNWKFQYASDFDLRGLQRVRFEIEKNTFSKSYWTRHFFILRKHNTSDFHLKVLQPLRDELTSGSFQLYIWRLKLQQTLSFIFPPQNKLLLTLKEKIFDQSELEKHDETQISERRTLKLVRFWIHFS